VDGQTVEGITRDQETQGRWLDALHEELKTKP